MKESVCIAIAIVVGVFVVNFPGTTEAAFGFGKSDQVLLEDISVLTLQHGKMTTGRRSSPVKQLQCVGGSAAQAFTPQVVQCYNRGSDGYDVQWECKSDMDNAYRFGKVEVICEGYSSPDDEYILRGSCGLEFTLEYTKEGMQQKNGGGNSHSYYGSNDGSYDNSYNHSQQKSSKVDWLFLAIVGVLMYVIYRTCIASAPTESGTAGTDDGYPRPGGTGFGPGGGGGGGGAPPPPGFRDDGYSGASCGGSQRYSSGAARGAGTGAGGLGAGLGGGGFWTGAAAGGLLGYLFGGNRNRGYGGYGGYGSYGRPRYGGGYSAPRYNSGFSSGWGGSGRSGGGFSGFGGGGGSSGTRTASGFGGTRRR